MLQTDYKLDIQRSVYKCKQETNRQMRLIISKYNKKAHQLVGGGSVKRYVTHTRATVACHHSFCKRLLLHLLVCATLPQQQYEIGQ